MRIAEKKTGALICWGAFSKTSRILSVLSSIQSVKLLPTSVSQLPFFQDLDALVGEYSDKSYNCTYISHVRVFCVRGFCVNFVLAVEKMKDVHSRIYVSPSWLSYSFVLYGPFDDEKTWTPLYIKNIIESRFPMIEVEKLWNGTTEITTGRQFVKWVSNY